MKYIWKRNSGVESLIVYGGNNLLLEVLSYGVLKLSFLVEDL